MKSFITKRIDNMCLQLKKIWYHRKGAANRKKNRRYSAAVQRAWRKRHYHKVLANLAIHRGYKLCATPSWLTKKHKKQIEKFYAKAVKLTKKTGTKYHVDHKIPLRSKFVCGLHVPWNLRVVKARINLRKSNKVEEKFLCC